MSSPVHLKLRKEHFLNFFVSGGRKPFADAKQFADICDNSSCVLLKFEQSGYNFDHIKVGTITAINKVFFLVNEVERVRRNILQNFYSLRNITNTFYQSVPIAKLYFLNLFINFK